MRGLATMVAGIVAFLVIANFVTPTVISGTDTGSTLIKAVFLLVVAAIVSKIAALKSNLVMRLSRIRWKLNSFEYANTELSRKLCSFRATCRAHVGYTLSVWVKICAEPNRKVSLHKNNDTADSHGSHVAKEWQRVAIT